MRLLMWDALWIRTAVVGVLLFIALRAGGASAQIGQICQSVQ